MIIGMVVRGVSEGHSSSEGRESPFCNLYRFLSISFVVLIRFFYIICLLLFNNYFIQE